MLKKIGLPMITLAAVLAFATPRQADARIRFGIGIGGPVYTAPVPVNPYGYTYPYPAYGSGYYAPPAYSYPYTPPVYVDPYVAPYGGFSFGFGGHRDYGYHGRVEGHGHGYGGHRR